MKTEILIAVTFLPLLFIIYDLTRIAKNNNRGRHGVLLGVGVMVIAYCLFSTTAKGLPPLQGALVAGICYGPVYFMTLAFTIAAEKMLRGRNGGLH